jgi:hypothetical protein
MKIGSPDAARAELLTRVRETLRLSGNCARIDPYPLESRRTQKDESRLHTLHRLWQSHVRTVYSVVRWQPEGLDLAIQRITWVETTHLHKKPVAWMTFTSCCARCFDSASSHGTTPTHTAVETRMIRPALSLFLRTKRAS